MFNPDNYSEEQLESIYKLQEYQNKMMELKQKIVNTSMDIFKIKYRATEYAALKEKISDEVIYEGLDKDDNTLLSPELADYRKYLYLMGSSYDEAEKEIMKNLEIEIFALNVELTVLNNEIMKIYYKWNGWQTKPTIIYF